MIAPRNAVPRSSYECPTLWSQASDQTNSNMG
jgi:hypothetical protein